jgi:hypothetical protein
MRLRDIMTVAGAAGITMAIMLMLLGPKDNSPAYAAPEVKPVIAQPKFQSQGCTFVLKTDKAAYEAGESPVFELTASNHSADPVDTTVWLSLMGSAPESAASRRASRPRTLWSHECAVSLLPKETKKIAVPCDAKPPAGESLFVVMTDKKETVRFANPEIRANVESVPSQMDQGQRARAAL